MEAFNLINIEIFKAIGWTVIHSIWQFLILLAILKVLLRLIKGSSSKLRYYASLLVIVLSLYTSWLTFRYEYHLVQNNTEGTITGDVFPNITTPDSQIQEESGLLVSTSSPALLYFINKITPYIAFLWMLGIIFYLGRIFGSSLHLRRLRELQPQKYPNVEEKLIYLCNRMQIKQKISLIISSKIFEPVTFGTIKPIILIPLTYVTKVPMEQLEMILAHELSHIKRHDFLINMIQTSFEAIYFFNPFFILISKTARDERECCCDDMAIQYCGNEKAMAIALANLKIITSYPELSLAASPLKSTLNGRVSRLMHPSRKTCMSLKTSLFLLVLTSLTLVLFTKCIKDTNNPALPTATDTLTQLLTDNQADHKVEVFNYSYRGQIHDIFLVSKSRGGKVLYAYLDGTTASKDQLQKINELISRKTNVIIKTSSKMDAKNDFGTDTMRLTLEINSIKGLIKSGKAIQEQESRLIVLNNQLNLIRKKIIEKDMRNYQEEANAIPYDVELHQLLNEIIVSKNYTTEQRMKLNKLILKKNAY